MPCHLLQEHVTGQHQGLSSVKLLCLCTAVESFDTNHIELAPQHPLEWSLPSVTPAPPLCCRAERSMPGPCAWISVWTYML